MLGGAHGFKLRADGNAGPDVIFVFLLDLFGNRHTEGDFGGFFHQDAVGEAGDDVGFVDNVRDFEAFRDEADGETDETTLQENDIGAISLGEQTTESRDETGEKAEEA